MRVTIRCKCDRGAAVRLMACLLPGAVALGAPGGLATPGQPAGDDQRGDRDLSKRLIHRATTGAEMDIMAQVTSLMSAAEDHLVRGLDSGPHTQTVQEQIVQRLNQAIELALQQRAPGRSRQRSEGERREMPKRPADTPDDRNDELGEETAGSERRTEPGSEAESDRRRGPFRESRRGWGYLPRRDRDELLQGIDEDFIERYRAQIEQYYRALTEGDEEQ